MNLKKPRFNTRANKSTQDTDGLVIQHAAECVEELLDCVRFNRGQAWFLIVERNMKRLLKHALK